MSKYDPIAYVYEADTHCPGCTKARFGESAEGYIAYEDNVGPSIDSEGNEVGAVFRHEEWPYGIVCGTCGGVILDPVEADDESDEDLW